MRRGGLLVLLVAQCALAFRAETPLRPGSKALRSTAPALKAAGSPATLTAQAPESVRPASTSVAGATALVAGTTIGAGILALPAKTLEGGFGPSAVLLIAAWAYMAATALLIAEGATLRLDHTTSGLRATQSQPRCRTTLSSPDRDLRPQST